MSKYLRTAVEQLKHFYIKKIIATGKHRETSQELIELTISELEAIYQHEYPEIAKNQSSILNPNRRKVSQNISKNTTNVRKYNIISI